MKKRMIEWAIFAVIGFAIGALYATPNATLSTCAPLFEQMGC